MNPLSSAKIFKIAAELDLNGALSPSGAIMQYCEQRVRGFLALLPDCSTPAELLDISAGMLKTKFECIRSDEEANALAQEFCRRGETGFATLASELGRDTYGITFRLLNAAAHERRFVSVIDCRGDKGLRSYFTKWHELGHLLILTDAERNSFRRSHATIAYKEPEEVLVDMIAGHLGFFPDFLKPELVNPLSLSEVTRIRGQLFPEASFASAAIACVRLHPAASLLVEAKMSLTEKQRGMHTQNAFDFFGGHDPKLRAVTVIRNDQARIQKVNVPRNFRIPERSVIHNVHITGIDSLTGVEDLEWWESSDGKRLAPQKVIVEARKSYEGVLAILRPAE